MVQRQPDPRPALRHFAGYSLESLERERIVRFVLQKKDTPPQIVVAHEPQERDHRTVRSHRFAGSRRHRCDEAIEVEGLTPDLPVAGAWLQYR